MQEISELTTGELLAVSSAYWRSCALHAGVELEIFSHLGDDSLTASEIAAGLDSDERGVTQLLDALVAMLLLEKENTYYQNTHSSKMLLSKQSDQYIGHIIMHHHHLVDGWAQLAQAVKTGRPVEKRSYGEEKERESFQMGMFNLAMAIAPDLAGQVNLEGRHHLLDLGGGPGTYAIHFCLENPELKATVFDRPTTETFANETARRFGVENRVAFSAGDFNIDPIPGRYDVAWLSHILHSNGPEECEEIIAKTVAAMEPGGLIMIHEFFLNDTMDGPLFPALFSLNMLLNNPRGRSYSEKEMYGMLERAGAKNIVRLPFQGPNDSYVLCGTV